MLLIVFVAILLLQVARRLQLPYPAMLAGAGVLIALLPGTPTISIEPETYLALFIAPVLVDAAFDFPPGATRRFLAPLIAFAVIAVVITSVIVGWIGEVVLGLPLAAGLALGAIVAPPDAAAATAVLRGSPIPRNTSALLQGESLFNDSMALLIFSVSLTVLSSHGLHAREALRLSLSVPGGIVLGIVCGYGAMLANRVVQGTLGGNLLQFVLAYAVWLTAAHLRLSAVLSVVAFAMTIARRTDAASFTARMRVQSYAVWSAVVFTLNVLAFMLMGMQARLIVGKMSAANLRGAFGFGALVIAAVVLVRMVVVIGFNRLSSWWQRAHGRPEAATLNQAVFVSWCGMRGFVTMATALALPAEFPRRDVVVLSAFCVVLFTLVLQGLTLPPLIRVLKLNRAEETVRELHDVRAGLMRAGLASLDGESGAVAESLRTRIAASLERCSGEGECAASAQFRELGLRTVKAKRELLDEYRLRNEVSVEGYLALQEQIDWVELTFVTDEDRRIEEI